jgi:hypothetical protein
MNNTLLFSLVLLISACSTSSPWVPLRADAPAPSELTLVWVGRGECERLEDGVWVRRPEFDYDFNVEQRRYADRWESVKSMRRSHPGYDGSAGDRLQHLYFVLRVPGTDARAPAMSSLGAGEWQADGDYRNAVVSLAAAGVSKLAPFDNYRITQLYNYEAGTLTERVDLNKGDRAWVRMNEKATLFAARTFDAAPTRRAP